MLFPIVSTIGLLIVIPAVFLFTLWKTSFTSKFEWIVDAVSTTAFVFWVFQSGNWAWIGYYFRYLLVVILVYVLIHSWRKVRVLPFKIKYNGTQLFTIGMYLFLIVLFGTYNVFAFTSYSTDDPAIELQFPLKDGAYYIGQGGNHVLLNYHQEYLPQQYALDILKVNTFGIRANGLYPKNLDKYQIYGEELYSPCAGKVIEAQNRLPDFTPPESDPKNATGNYIALICDHSDATIYIAHMQEGSVMVTPDEKVQAGQKIGNVGNSGNTSEPHLHIHAEKDGVGIPIQFNNKFLARNNLMR
ncbi:M23 family metallopeptidase [Sporosarcina sp. FA9]|uniref:M23 family metallopeptidase n=1 Tax=Sporosarcina sp. FA9 TaxID=3413030 RepID=UPI003F659D22